MRRVEHRGGEKRFGPVGRDHTVQADPLIWGVHSHDRSEALFSAAVLDTTHPDPPAPLKMRGLEPNRTYRVAPVFIGTIPSGLIPPAWWGEPSDAEILATQEYWDRAERAGVADVGARFRGDVLATVGVASPRLHPDQAVLYHVVAED